MQTHLSRKRAAPGAAPAVPSRSGMGFQNVQDVSELPTDHYTTWDGSEAFENTAGAFPDSATYDGNFFNSAANNGMQQQAGGVVTNNAGLNSNQLVRRDRNQQLTTINRTPWQEFGGSGNGQVQNWENSDDEDDLEAKALTAKREAQAKRKQIPPFVQKLSSFLDEKRNTDLIRWSDDGLSFIVLNEDEFAKTLIPELFKHNNYASFVRQLNMYGFHKKVGLSDNSMKSSEQKVKNPSEYYNKYFRRGRPELLWLIQKPKNTGGSKRKRDDDKAKGDGDSDDENKKFQPETEINSTGEIGLVQRNQDMALIPTKEIVNLRRELQQVQRQQQFISAHINKIKQQNEQLYQQAAAFQTLHERHENSINAILTFLATFYNRQLDQNSVPNLQDMFQNVMPTAQHTRGNVVDVGDYNEVELDSEQTPHRVPKRPLALLPAPDPKDVLSPITQTSPRAQSIRSPSVRPASRQGIFRPPIPMSRSPSLSKQKNAPTMPQVDKSVHQGKASGSEDMMSVINNANATSGMSEGGQSPNLDFTAALNHFQNMGGQSPLTQQQRNDMLSMIAANSPSGNTTDGLPSSNSNNNNNALMNPNPPPMPSLDNFAATQAQLDMLQKLQEEQDSKVQHIAERLQPLSPSGQIPGFVVPPGGGLTPPNFSLNNYSGGSGDQDIDLNNFINSDDYFTDAPGSGQFHNTNLDANFPDMDLSLGNQPMDFDPTFGFDSTSDPFGPVGGSATANDVPIKEENDDNRIESVSSSATSPAAAPSPSKSPDKKRRRKS